VPLLTDIFMIFNRDSVTYEAHFPKEKRAYHPVLSIFLLLMM